MSNINREFHNCQSNFISNIFYTWLKNYPLILSVNEHYYYNETEWKSLVSELRKEHGIIAIRNFGKSLRIVTLLLQINRPNSCLLMFPNTDVLTYQTNLKYLDTYFNKPNWVLYYGKIMSYSELLDILKFDSITTAQKYILNFTKIQPFNAVQPLKNLNTHQLNFLKYYLVIFFFYNF